MMKRFFSKKKPEYTNPQWITLVDENGSRSRRTTRIIGSLAICAIIVVGLIFYTVSANNPEQSSSSASESTSDSSETEVALASIRSAIADGEYNLAQDLLDQQMAEYSDDPLVVSELTKLQEQITALAIESVEQASEELDNLDLGIISDPEQLFQLGTDAFANEQWATAIDRFEQLRELNDTYQREAVEDQLVTAYLNAAANATATDPRNRTNLEMALRYYQNALFIEPDEPTAQLEKEFLGNYLIGERALETESFREAVNMLLPIYRERPQYLSGWSAQQLYNSYIALGDSAMRRGDRNTAVNYFNLANELDVADTSAGDRRLQSMALLPSPTPGPERPTATPEPVTQVAVVPTVVEETPTPEATPTPALNPPACPDPRSVIALPLENQVVSGYVQIFGTAQHDEFTYYKLEFAPRTSAEFAFLESREQQIIDGALGGLNSQTIPNGDYTIRLIVVDERGNYPPPCEVHITVEN